MIKKIRYETVTLDKIVGGGQALGTLADGRKAFVWGGLPGETVTIRVTKKKSHFIEGIVTEILTASSERIAPRDPESFISTSPWQIMKLENEQLFKAALIEEAFELHNIVLPKPIEVYTDGVTYEYRNKMEYSWFSSTDPTSGVDTLDLAFFARGSKGKYPVDHSSLARPEITKLAQAVLDLLSSKHISARQLKTLLIRSDQKGNAVWQLYLKDEIEDIISDTEAAELPAIGGEVIYSNPKSPASVITKRLASFGSTTLEDTILDVPFRYAVEGFFQVNIPVYEQALRDMHKWVESAPTIDLYSGVGSIGLTIGNDNTTLIEINEHAVREMRENIKRLGKNANAVLAPSEQALEYITGKETVIVDPPRAGLHADVIARLLETKPRRIVYLSCNPVTQARDVAMLGEVYGVRAHRGYNFFPRTPHIEHLVVLDLIEQ
jgi:23S rRNA (uracil1939-C5)-methyltransferase